MTKALKSIADKTIAQLSKERIAFLTSRMKYESKDDREETLNEINYCKKELERLKKGSR